MATIIRRSKALSVSPLKASQTLGAALAFLGFQRAIPMLHGSQGCTAFGKVFFVRHFREPIPLQTTAMDQVTTVMGSEEAIVEGLKTLCEKSAPALIGVPTTGLAETQGSDPQMAITQFRQRYPQFAAIPIVAISTPDFSGALESGFAKATAAIIAALVPSAVRSGSEPGRQPRQVNVLVGSALTPGDIEALQTIIAAFDLEPLLLPDLSDSLDGHLDAEPFSPLTIGGTEVAALQRAGDAVATLVIGRSMCRAADTLQQLTGVPDYRFDHLMGLAATDTLLLALSAIAERPVPPKLERQRAQLQDAMLDCHFMLGMGRFAIAADPDLLHAFSALLDEVGGRTVAAVAPINAPILQEVAATSVKIGDLEDLEQIAREQQAELLISNSHGAESAARLGIPLLRAGFPQYDQLGGYQRCWIGYQGSRQTLFDLANMMLNLARGEIHPYHSLLAQKGFERPLGGST